MRFRFAAFTALVALAFLVLFQSNACTAESKVSELFDAARSAVAEKQVDKTVLGGLSVMKTPFTDTPRSGILVGFDLGLGKYVDHEVVYALRPIYLTPEGVYSTKNFGSFAEAGRGRASKGKITRTKQIKAKPGYAVGAIRIKKEQGIRALSLIFMKIDGAALNPDDAYASPWMGDNKAGEETLLSGEGAPIVGIHGNCDDDKLLGLGLQFIRNAKVKSKAAASSGQTAAATKAEPGDKTPAKPADAAAASSKNEDVETDTTVVEEAEEDATPQAAESPIWIPLVIFGVVALPIFLVMLALFGRKSTDTSPRQPMAGPGNAPPWMTGQGVGGLTANPYGYQQPYINANAAAWKSMYMGAIGMVAWCLPIAGVPVNIIGLTSGMKGLQGDRAVLAVIGIILSSFGLLLSVVNAILGVMMATGNFKP